MKVDLLWISAVLLSSPLLTLCAPLMVLTAPNMLRVGSSEKVFVEAQDYFGGDLQVKVSVTSFPQKIIQMESKFVTLNAGNNYQQLVDIKIPENKEIFGEDPLEKQYVYLQAHFPTGVLEKVVLVSFQSGYIFIQTDKSIYTPSSTVNYRLFSLTPDLQPLEQSDILINVINPQGFTIHADTASSKGIIYMRYNIPDPASPGIWTMLAQYRNTPQMNFTAQFEVKEYVLPTFEVTLNPSKSFFYVDDVGLDVDIRAKYLFDNKVEGTAFVVFGVMQGDSKTSLPASLRRVPISDGAGRAQLTREMILKTFPDISQLVGSSLYISVSVLTDTGSELVEAQRKGIQIVTSPYTIHFKRTLKFFKPGMPFDVTVYVTNPDQTPAENLDVEVNPGGVRGRTKANGIARITINTQRGIHSLPITVKTKDPAIADSRQDVKHMTAQAYATKGGSNNYLHIGTDAAELRVGDLVKMYVNFNNAGDGNHDFTYLILSKGQIVEAKRFKRQGQGLMLLSIPVSKDLLPSFRVVAYYHVGESEVVADSVWVDVKDTCIGTLRVEVKEPKRLYSPGERFSLKITGDPGAKVGLVAVDNGAFVLNKNHLTQNKIWDIIEKHDTGCTVGSGKDSMGVFYDAGLLFESDKAGGTDPRTTPDCPTSAKRKRRSEDDEDFYIMADEISSRTQFTESWLWLVNMLPTCLTGQCASTSLKLDNYFLKDSMTTWQILAISVSKTHGICVADPYEMIVRKDFFLDLKLPYSAVRNEQLEIKAILHNFSNRKHKVRVEFTETEHVCSSASKKGKYRTTINVDAKSSRSISYIIIPMELGDHWIEVKAAAYDSALTDGVRKVLKVVPEGVLTAVEEMNVKLNPSKAQAGVEVVRVKTDIPDRQIPNTPASTYVTVSGQQVRQTIEVINGDFMGRLILHPYGSAETNIMYMSFSVITTHYLDTTRQWEGVLLQRRALAINHMKTGYSRQLTFRKTDGSYGTFLATSSSTWLTAYVAKVFTMARDFISIENNVICSALKWLILNCQTPEGMFKENMLIVFREMDGDVRGTDADASLTAFSLIAMQEGSDFCYSSVSTLQESMRKATEFLQRRISTLTNPYAVAMTSYAMANAGKFNKDLLMRHSSGDGTFWQASEGQHSLEATAYALLALVKAMEFEAAGKVVNWLNRQTGSYGTIASTQATIMVFQAVAEYYKQVKRNLDDVLEVELAVSGLSRPIKWSFKKDILHPTRSFKVQFGQQLNVTAKGSGAGSLKVVTMYYARPTEKDNDCKMFDLSVKMEKQREASYTGAKESYLLTIETKFKSQTRDATMSILDISLLTGFLVDERDLVDLTTGRDRYIQKFEMDKQLSERGSLILYLDKISNKVTDRIAFRVHKFMEVSMLQPAGVTVYEYFSPEIHCVKYYHPLKKDGTLNRLCSDQEGLCQCAEENCSIQKKQNIEEKDREQKACEAGMDYVYKVKVVSIDQNPNTDFYTMRIEQVLKLGADIVLEGELRKFMGHPNCRESFGFGVDKTYLIMGRSLDLPKINGRLQYILGEQTWIEYWPTREEGQTAQYRNKYLGITELAQSLMVFGCTT